MARIGILLLAAALAAGCAGSRGSKPDSTGDTTANLIVRRGGRYHAVALRLQGLDGRWQCTALQLG